MTDQTPEQKKTAEFNAKVSALQKKYLDGLNDKEQEIRRHLEKFWETIDWPREDIVELHRLCHNLAGSAKVFDREQISLIAKDAAIHLQNVLDSKEVLNSEFKATIYEIVNALRKQIALGSVRSNEQQEAAMVSAPFVTVSSNSTVILVDDEVQQANLLKLEMEAAGYEVILFYSLTEFRKFHWPDSNPAAIIMDMVFPEGEDAGAKALKEVLANANVDNHIPLVFMSVRDDMSARLSALRAGADRYLVKPIAASKLVGMLDGMTQRVPADPYRVLLIDDEETLAEYYAAMLREAGLDTRVLTNPMLALEHAESFHPDVIVTDVYMPQCMGTELSVIIREKESLAQIPIIYLSAEKDIEKQIAALDRGADEFLSKPVDATHLVTIVRGRARRFRHLQRINHDLEVALREIKSQKIALDEHAVVSIADVAGNIEYANDKFCQISGYSRAELLGRNHRLLKSGIHDDSFYSGLWETIASGKVWQGEICNRGKNGHLYWVESTIVPLLGKDGIPLRYISVRTDITALNASRLEAEKANRAKSEFLSSMSHELRTPMNAILGFGQLLVADTSDPLSEGQAESVHEIVKAGMHLLELINDVLDLSKIEGGGLKLNIGPVLLADLIVSSVHLIVPMAQKRDIRIQTDEASCSHHVVLADATRLRQVILNFLSNAVKYNQDAGWVRIYCETLEPGVLRVNIEDNGKGIPEEMFDELFTSFSRLGAERTDIEGTGIGLVITKHMVERMNGRVGVRSQTGEGSTFWFELPLAETNEQNLFLPEAGKH